MENNNLDNQKYIRAQKKVKAIKGFYVHLFVYSFRPPPQATFKNYYFLAIFLEKIIYFYW